MNKNNIDKFFRQKFKDFGEIPDEKVWDSIVSSLDKKKKKRGILPIWWKLGGVAALLAVLFYIVNPFETKVVPAVVNTETEQVGDPNKTQQNDQIDKGTIKPVESDTKVVKTTAEDEKRDNSADISNGATENSTIASKNENAAIPLNNNEPNVALDNLSNEDKNSRLAAAVTNTTPKTELDNEQKEGDSLTKTPKVAEITNVNSLENSRNASDKVEEQVVAKLETSDKSAKQEKKSILDEIEQEEDIVADANGNKWSVGPSVAPVFLSSFGEGSPIHSNFVSNSKSGNLNLSYGLSVSYVVSKKLSVRSGIHKVDYGYDTNDVLFSSSLAASTNNKIDNIDYALASKNLVVQSSADSEANLDPSFAVTNEIAAPSPSRDGSMLQQFGYLEVPIELNYALVDRKIGVHIIGGLSSLFLIDNRVSLESDGGTTEIGEANNINSLNFSTNIGFGVNYKFSPKVQLNLEPMFKYQLNTFSDTSGNFQPFSVGVYSGLNFRF